jgi:flagellar motility protein MotE (MotC chaperone)
MKKTRKEITIKQTEGVKNMDIEMNLADILRPIWEKRKFILILSSVFFLFGLLIAYLTPVEYTADTTMIPQGTSSKNNNIGSIASVMGINMGTAIMNEGTFSPSMYPAIIKSTPFCLELMNTEVVVARSEGTPVTLYDYYTNKELRQPDKLAIFRRFTIGLPRTIANSFRKNNNSLQSSVVEKRNDSTLLKLTPGERSAIGAIKKAILLESNSKEGTVKLGYSFPEPEACAQIAENVRIILEKYVTQYKIDKVKQNLAFVEESYRDARNDFISKQTQLASFRDSNRGLVTSMAQATEERLRSEYSIAFTIYNEIAKQHEQANLAVK